MRSLFRVYGSVVLLAAPGLLGGSIEAVERGAGDGDSTLENRVATDVEVAADRLDPRRSALVSDFASIGRDFGRMLSGDSLLVMAGGSALSAVSHVIDDRAVASLHASPRSDGVFELGEVTGTWYALGGSAVALYSIGRLADRPQVGDLGRDLIRAQLVSQSVTHALKAVSRRVRPDGTTGSFPSGHTSGAFAFATVLHEQFGARVGLPALVAAGYVGVSRMQENRHFLSDVVFGAALGIAAGRSVQDGRRRVRIVPLATSDAIGLSFLIHR